VEKQQNLHNQSKREGFPGQSSAAKAFERFYHFRVFEDLFEHLLVFQLMMLLNSQDS